VKHSNDQSIGDAIRQFLQAYRLEDKLNETRLISCWEKVLGKLVANHTKSISIKNKILFVRIDSAALRNELSYSKQKIIKSLNEEVKAEVIEDVVFN
jgi:predicted nucleic acid-binding Zn ribbon protein